MAYSKTKDDYHVCAAAWGDTRPAIMAHGQRLSTALLMKFRSSLPRPRRQGRPGQARRSHFRDPHRGHQSTERFRFPAERYADTILPSVAAQTENRGRRIPCKSHCYARDGFHSDFGSCKHAQYAFLLARNLVVPASGIAEFQIRKRRDTRLGSQRVRCEYGRQPVMPMSGQPWN